MTHDELTAMLRNLPAPSIGGAHPGGVQMLAADRLDLYRDLLNRAKSDMQWCGENHDDALLAKIVEALR